jgi:N-acyl-D-amino-acid deacylase
MGVTTAHAADWSALRGADSATAQRVAQSGARLEDWDGDGNTALIVAALHASADAVEVLLNAGANANATNKAVGTALIYAAGDGQKVLILLRHGADPNHCSVLGNTPLIAAAGLPDTTRPAALLLAAGARVGATNSSGVDALNRATYAGNTKLVKLLLRYGANPNTRPIYPTLDGDLAPEPAALHNAAFRGDPEMVRALLDAGADLNAVDPFAGSALHNALYGNHPQAAAFLIKRGISLDLATSRGDVPTMVWSGYSDVGDSTVARLLLSKGVNANEENEAGETALTWAHKRGNNSVVQFLVEHGATDPVGLKAKTVPARTAPPPGTPAWRAAIRESVQKSIGLLEVASPGFLNSKVATRNGCVSCHHQTLPAVAFAAARARGIQTDDAVIKRQTEAQISSWSKHINNAYEMDEPQPDAPLNLGYGLNGLAALGHKPDGLTDAMVWYLAMTQQHDGSWRCDDFRPPLEDGQIPATALALHALQLYPIRGREAEFRSRVSHASDWLGRAKPKTLSQLNYKLLGLSWAGADPRQSHRMAERVLRAQRADGGWAQFPGLESDAWATGQALVVLKQAGAVTVNDGAYQRGVAFLLSTQFDDGSWFVRSRTWPFQPYFHSGFPHGKDQWISAAATAWSALALMNTIEVPYAEAFSQSWPVLREAALQGN